MIRSDPMRPILVVEDDPDIRGMIQMLLELEGYAVLVAENGLQALDLIRAGRPPGLIFLDLMMPVMNGWQFREAQLADATLAAIPVVVISGDRVVTQDPALARIADWLKKPVDLEDLLAIVRRHL